MLRERRMTSSLSLGALASKGLPKARLFVSGGAGLIHMIPNNWPINGRDMDSLYSSQANYESLVAAMGKNFFQSAAYGWLSVGAWYKITNGATALRH